MSQAEELVIRPYGRDSVDEKVARFYVSKANMEPLAAANVKGAWGSTVSAKAMGAEEGLKLCGIPSQSVYG